VIEELDWSVGEIVKTLKQEELINNTLVIFTSDNGPWTMFREFGGRPIRFGARKGQAGTVGVVSRRFSTGPAG